MINLITSILMISAFGLAIPQNKVHYDYYDYDNYVYIELEKPKEKLVSYDDEEYTITLSVDELNNYRFVNLANYINTEVVSFTSTSIEYYDSSFMGQTSHIFSYADIEYNSQLSYENADNDGENNILGITLFLTSEDNRFLFYDDVQSVEFEFVDTLIWKLNSTIYSGIKQAIEADISANSSPSYQNILVEALELLTGGLTTIAAALGSGMAAYVEGLLISGTSMSAFASVIFLFGGIALAFALGRWIVNFIGSLGKRNR